MLPKLWRNWTRTKTGNSRRTNCDQTAHHAMAKAAAAVDRVMASVAEKVADHQVVEKAIVLQTLASFSTES